MSQQRNIELIEAGREATLVRAAIKSVVDEQVTVAVSHLMSMYRQGSIDHDMLVGKVAEITAMDNLLAELESRERRAETAAQKELG